ncbi:TonB-dependent receptor domain-containing protein [Sediminibacterium ginsengisoli]|uniref:Outer membrane receptor proteins, mostly Fe transport n=1 Tax=Sediminibacterium ginsengisoli TaxID=413434 RepID=A0A1T4R2D7_9BACT|nr:TonB-dependent receptor [Sediminibacterium ginsengisoli]SKA10027.1 Outer membrane receptor proteins, mostly Fe transport [Sediminibacterium ginsengisoli]
MTLRKHFTLLLFFLAAIAVHAQSQTNISGIITDKNSRQPIEFASIELLHKDSTLVKRTVTDAKGKFTIDQVTAGHYLVRCSFVGYENNIITVNAGKSTVNLGTIMIIPASGTLNNVTVSAGRAILNSSIDRKSYDVTRDIMAQSGTASDILKNVPSVEVDLEGNVSLRGSGDVMILINGRPSPLLGKLNKAEVLQQFPASSIEKIEVITNPSARYRPDGTSGIINIVLKKNVKGGWNGTIIANAGNRDRYNASASFNYKPGKLNIFGNYGIRQDSRRRTNSISREYDDTISHAVSGYYDETGVSLTRPLTHLATIGFTYAPDKKNSFGISANYQNRDQVKNDINTKIFSAASHTYTSYFDRLRYDPESEKEKDATAFLEHQFPGEDHVLRAELTVSSSKELEQNFYTNQYKVPANYSTKDNTRIYQGDDQQQLTIDYTNTLSESSKLEAGYSGFFNQQDFNFFNEYYDQASNKFVTDKVKTNRFLFRQTIHALYGTYQKNYKRFGYSVGLRIEQSLINGYQVTSDTTIRNNYLKLYPTLHLAYMLKGQDQLQLNYSRRVHRPEGDDLNPFPEYQDPYNVRAGNAALLPEIIHSVEFGYKWQHKSYSFVPSLYYRYKQNGFTQVTVPLNDSVLLTTQQNLANDESAGLELIFSAKTGNFISSNLNVNFFYNRINAANLGYFDRRTILSFSTNFNTTLTISPATMVQISANYRSARLTPQGKNYPSFVLNTGIRQDLFNKKMSLIVTVSDILRSLQQKSELNTSYLKQVSVNRRDGQILYVGISYRFGKLIKKADDKLQFDTN